MASDGVTVAADAAAPPLTAASLRQRREGAARDNLRKASGSMFASAGRHGRDLVYGAVGGADYVIEAGSGATRTRTWGVMDAVKALGRDPTELRVLDIGTGDGKLLWTLHQQHGVKWENMIGVTAEDMRGVQSLKGVEPFDLRQVAAEADAAQQGSGGTCATGAEAAYIVWNAEQLDECPAMQGRQFDLIVSWMTFCWLSDPLGSLELLFDRFLAPKGLLVAGAIQMLPRTTQSEGAVEDLRYFSTMRERLRDQGRRVDIFGDAGTPWYAWWLLQKNAPGESLGLYPLVDYHTKTNSAAADDATSTGGAEDNEVEYDVAIERGEELPYFDRDRATTLQW